MGDTKLQHQARRRHREAVRATATELRRIREDAGLTQATVARTAGICPSYLSEIEAGDREPTLETLHALAAVLGCDLSLRLFPSSGPVIRDRFQARIVEALLGILHPRWDRFLEVPVQRPVHGVIDVVLADGAVGLLVATEVQSDLRRVEQQLRWAHEKADALANTDLGARSRAEAPGDIRISRLLVLRSTQRTRTLARELAATFATEFPADAKDTLAALTTADAPWPGAALLWATADGRAAQIQTRRVIQTRRAHHPSEERATGREA